jgi:endonuclease/exonuclease/phosphatase family metal-dependent hydrolase
MKFAGKKFVVVVLLVVAGLAALFAAALLFFTVAAYRPQAELELEALALPGPTPAAAPGSGGGPGDLSLLSWNLGYAGLDRYTDFVMEGGTMGLPRSREAVTTALDKIRQFLSLREADLYFLQEVDLPSSRSFKIDQIQSLTASLDGYAGWFAPNYKALFVPYPLSSPMGQVHSGILTLSRYASPRGVRYQLPGHFSWPVSVFNLRRCALLIRIPSPEPDRDWCLINVHLSAYDNGTMRVQELAFIKETITALYREGHYVVVGGDWNSLFPGVGMNDFGPYTTPEEALFWVQSIPGDWTLPGWQWCYDASAPTCRALNQPYQRGENFVTVIDGFYVSPNIEVRGVQTFDSGFEYSDHNPVEVFLRAKME